jgi:hypothetical protein
MAVIKTVKEQSLSALGDAIRAKTGGTEPLLFPDGMVAAIEGITTGGGEGLSEEAFIITNDCRYRFANNGWNWFVENYGNKITTNNISNGGNMFISSTKLESAPLTLNFVGTEVDVSYMFRDCTKLKVLPEIGLYNPKTVFYMFSGCKNIREIPKSYEDNIRFTYMEAQGEANNLYNGEQSNLFYQCNSLRKIPMGIIKSGNKTIRYNSSYFYSGFSYCYSLDEIIGLPLFYTGVWTSNAFNSTFNECNHVKEITFETNENGTPKTMNWKSQVIDLTKYVGYAYSSTNITGCNSGIDWLKKVNNSAEYQALKNDPDWFSDMKEYSRYNHDSAVNTINSLPDTSAYLATAGGTNTIKFKGDSGSKTDGGAINTLTEEEIAVAAAKGWTVTLV